MEQPPPPPSGPAGPASHRRPPFARRPLGAFLKLVTGLLLFLCGGTVLATTLTSPHRAVRASPAAAAASPAPVEGAQPAPTTATPPGASAPPAALADQVTAVYPGGMCSQHWAYGVTARGTLVRCVSYATDPQFRWRRA